jgi:C1A family cysteine protease
MKRAWVFIIVALSVLSVLTGCLRKPMDNIQNQEKLYLGYNPLPREFLEFWFENIEKIRSGELDPIKFSSDSKLPASSKQIADTQIILTEPLTDSLPSSYVAPHTPPKDQGQNGTCWAFATVGSLESALLTQLGPDEIASRYPFLNPYNPDLSEQFVAYHNLSPSDEENPYQLTVQESNRDTGGNTFFSTFNIIRRGVPEEKDFPYITDEQGWIKWNAINENWKYNLVRPYRTVCIPDFYYYRAVYKDYTTYINTIKSAIMQYGAVAAMFMVYEDFYDYWWFGTSGKVYIKSPSASSLGGHAVLIVGWVDNYHDFISGYSGPIWVIKNSWGTVSGFSLSDYGLSSDTTGGYFALPMLTEDEYNNEQRVDWKVEYYEMYVPVVE